MFSLLVASDRAAWETDQLMRMLKERFGESSGREGTSIALANPTDVERIQNAPALLMYEYTDHQPHRNIVRIGRLQNIAIAGQFVTFQFLEQGRISSSIIQDFASRLGIDRYEFGRMHWAIKDGGIPSAIFDQMVPSPQKSGAPVTSLMRIIDSRDLRSVEAEIDRALKAVD